MDARTLARYGAYPIVMLMLVSAVAVTPGIPLAFAWLAALAAAGLAVVAGLERVLPYNRAWRHADVDLPADIAHAIVNLAVMHLAVLALAGLRQGFRWEGVRWPDQWPYLAQVFLAGAPLDLSLYLVHRLSHRYGFLWRLHSIHHASRRLYWLNGERRHPLHAALMAGPGLIVLGILGAPALVVGGWFAILAVHLAFQHANFDYRLGELKRVFGVAEIHRWHHRERFEDAQVNFGEFWLVWDHLFGTFLLPREPLGRVGIEGDPVPHGYAQQLVKPFLPPR